MENVRITRKDLQIFRGTYEECMAQPTVNMMIYLAWDTQQIFVGNKNGIKTPYSGQTEKYFKRFLSRNLRDSLDEIKLDFERNIDAIFDGKERQLIESATNSLNQNVQELVSENVSKLAREGGINLDGYAKTTDIPTKLSDLQNNGIYAKASDVSRDYALKTQLPTQTDIDKWNAGVTNVIRCMTGAEISAVDDNINNFLPTFCTATSGRYEVGNIYYRQGDVIVAMSGGGSGTATQAPDAGLSISSSSSSWDFEIGSDSLTITVTPNITNRNYIESYSFITPDNSYNNYLPSAEIGAQTVVFGGTGVNVKERKENRTYQFSLTATPKSGYTAKSIFKTVTFYKPEIVCNNRKYKKAADFKGFSVSANQKIVIYASKDIMAVKDKSTGFSISLTKKATENININGLMTAYYRYESDPISEDTNFVVECLLNEGN